MERVWEDKWPKQEPFLPPVPEKPIFHNLGYWAERAPDRVAIIYYGREITYRELDEASDALAASLAEMGVEKGDRVGLYMENCPQFVMAYYGILKAGGVAVACSPMFKEDELRYELQDAGIKVLFIEESLYPTFEKVRGDSPVRELVSTAFLDYLPEEPSIPLHPTMSTEKNPPPQSRDFLELVKNGKAGPREVEVSLEDLAMLQYTAGTTGYPKGAMLTHANLAWHGAAIRHIYRYSSEDVHIIVLPLFHITGLDICMNPALAAGGKIVLFTRFDLAATLESIMRYKATVWVTIAPINMAVIFLPNVSEYDFSSLRYVISGGAPVPLDIHAKWEEVTGTKIYEGYGLSEATGGIIGNTHSIHRPGTVGCPLYWLDIKVTDPEDEERELGFEEEGELWVKGPYVMKGYWQAPEQTAQVLSGDGWLRTGDIAKVSEEGVVSIVGRRKEMIKVSGYTVFLAEIDNFLYRHPAVAEATTIGGRHPYRGEEPVAVVVLKPEYKGKVTEEEFIDWCREKMSAYKYPRRVVFVDSLPKSGAGKILRRLVQEKYAEG
ncbi:MAG: AMP-binding protein [Actinobacteria bacterium]|nr:AMP-binding protein [Actinomycetota bacterium]